MVKKLKIGRVQITFTNRWFYTFIAIGILAIIGVGVYALTPGVAPNPGHLIDNVAPPAGCGDGEVLQFIDEATGWGCVDNEVEWGEISGIPSGFADDVDNTGNSLCTLTDCENFDATDSLISWILCPEETPVLKGFKQKLTYSHGTVVVHIDYIQCCAISCS